MVTVLSTLEILEILEKVRSSVVTEHLHIFIKLATMLAAFIASWSYIKISHDYMEGNGITFWMFLKPLVILLLVANFNTFILSPIHSLTTVFSKELTYKCYGSQEKVLTLMAEAEKKLGKQGINDIITKYNDAKSQSVEAQVAADGEKTVEEDESWWDKLLAWGRGARAAVLQVPVSMGNIMRGSVTNGLFGIGHVLMTIVYACQIVLCYIYLAIYGLLGPFAFAFSILNSYSRGITDWIARYVQTAFWVPVGQIVFLICSVVMENILVIQRGDVGSIDGAEALMAFSSFNIGSWLGIIMVIVTIFSILAVPKICSYIIESTGTAGAAQSVTGGLSNAARIAGRLGR